MDSITLRTGRTCRIGGVQRIQLSAAVDDWLCTNIWIYVNVLLTTTSRIHLDIGIILQVYNKIISHLCRLVPTSEYKFFCHCFSVITVKEGHATTVCQALNDLYP